MKQWPRARHSPAERSHILPLVYGPRSITGAVTVLPLCSKVTIVPHASVLWATPTMRSL